MWVRSYGSESELVVVSDSRVGGGKRWDHCPKIFPMTRGDCIISFSGETDYAYPLLAHAANAIESWDESANRRFKLEQLRGYLARMFTSTLDGIDVSGLSDDPTDYQTFLLLGGYSWWSKRWVMWELRWDSGRTVFSTRTLKSRNPDQRGAILWTGDKDAIFEAKRRLRENLSAAGVVVKRDGLNMQPLEVVRDVIRSGDFDSVGGPLQLGKVYRHLHSRLFVIPWDRGGEPARTLGGRYLLEEEKSTWHSAIDPDRPDVFAAPLDQGPAARPAAVAQ